jgi:hypothetical protein
MHVPHAPSKAPILAILIPIRHKIQKMNTKHPVRRPGVLFFSASCALLGADRLILNTS